MSESRKRNADHSKSAVNITLAKLHQALKDCLLSGKLPVEDEDHKSILNSYKSFAYYLLPEELYWVLSCSIRAEEPFTNPGGCRDMVNRSSRTTLNHVFNNNDPAKTRYQEASKIILQNNAGNGESESFSDSIVRSRISGRWEKILNNLSQNEITSFQTGVQLLIREDIGDKRKDLRTNLLNLYEKSFKDCLTSLTIIASTLYCWNNTKPSKDYDPMLTMMMLLKIILPEESLDIYLDAAEEQRLKENARLKASNNLKHIHHLLQQSNAGDDIYGILNDNNIQTIIKHCQENITTPYLDDARLLGESNYILYRCYITKKSNDVKELSENDQDIQKLAYNYLRESQKYGYEMAMKEDLPADYSLAYKSQPLQVSPRYCYYNSENIYISNFKNTLPEPGNLILKPYREMDETILLSGSPEWFLFFSEDTCQNFRDTLSLLQTLQKLRSDNKLDADIDIEIFMRGDEEIYAPLINTSLSLMQDMIIPVHILDDDKRSAQYLLSRHPLFYPIRNVSPDDTSLYLDLNFIIIGDDTCAEWLAREAFWLMGFTAEGIMPKIHILGPDADFINRKIHIKCPGMQKNNIKIQETIPDTNLPEILSHRIFLDAWELEDTLKALIDSSPYNYIAITGSGDEYNLELAIRIREWLMRRSIGDEASNIRPDHNALSSRLNNMPPIAFRCKDPHIAYLSRKLAVGSETSGEFWYNSYGLIPFGSCNEIYTADNLGGGILEQLSICAHLQYSSKEPVRVPDIDTASILSIPDYRDALKSYYRLQYNKESSFSAALSLPYRLFNCLHLNNRILPEAWNILDDQAWFSPAALQKLAGKAAHIEKYNSIDKLARWEHERWTRYMLSRCWMPAKNEEKELYTKLNNGKHQLYAAKLHPLIKDYDELNNDDKKYDISSLKMTSQILKREWLIMSDDGERPL